MYFYVDGDNSPGGRTVGMSKLKSTDVVKVFYAVNNKHFCQESVREELCNRCRGIVEFISVKAGANTVDFAIAVHIARDCESGKTGKVVCMVSGDKHFDIVKSELSTLYEDIVVNRVETVEEGIMRYYMLDIESLGGFQEALEQQYGLKTGQQTYRRIMQLFMESTYPAVLPLKKSRKPVLKFIKDLI